MAISKRLRFEIFRRDDFTCRYCGLRAGENSAELTVDHVVPIALGGTDDPTNLVTACKDCNAGKSSIPVGSPIVEDVATDALRWVKALEIAGRRQAESFDADLDFTSEVYKLWETYIPSYVGPPPGDFEETCGLFRRYGLRVTEFERALMIAASRPYVEKRAIWKYAVGILWNWVRERQKIAAQLIAEGDA